MSSCGMRSYVTPRVTATSDSLVISLARATVPAKLSFYVHFNWFRKEFQKDPLKIHYPVVMGYLFACIQTIYKDVFFKIRFKFYRKCQQNVTISLLSPICRGYTYGSPFKKDVKYLLQGSYVPNLVDIGQVIWKNFKKSTLIDFLSGLC